MQGFRIYFKDGFSCRTKHRTDSFVASVLAGLDKRIQKTKDPESDKREIEVKRKKFLAKKNRYQEMYANDLITMDELKEKLCAVSEELKAADMDLAKIVQAAKIVRDTEIIAKFYRQEITRFLELETATNMDMRRVIDHILVDKDRNIRVILKKIEDLKIN